MRYFSEMNKSYAYYKKLLSSIFILLVICILYSSKAFSYELNAATSYDFSSLGDFEENKSVIIEKAKKDACFNAFNKYIATFDQDKLQNYKRVKNKIESNIKSYMVCDQIVDENLDFSKSTYSIVVKANISSSKIDQEMINSSAVKTNTGETSDIVLLMFSAKTKSIKQKVDRVTKVDQTKKSIDIKQTEATGEGETLISSETADTNVATTGGNTVTSSETITYEISDIYNEAIEAGMAEILNTAGFELIDGGDLDLEEQIETIKSDYGETGRLSKAVQKSIKKNIASEGISFYVQGIFKIGSQEIDGATGHKVVNVSVVSAKMMHRKEGKKYWKLIETVAGNQRKGKGTTYDQAINNAIRLCSQSVAKQMVNKLNARGIK
jgi:hypothetical protein